MVAWLNVAVLVVATLLTLVFYVKSAGPAALEQRIGPTAYNRCKYYRFLSAAAMTLATLNYVVYFFHPLPISLPATFPWPWWLSALIAVMIAIPSGYIWWRGMKDAGEETMVPRVEHTMYSGIYDKIRHPQALGELPFWWVVALLLHSPFLALYSLVWVPIFVLMCLAEERDLVIRYGQAYEEYRHSTGFFVPRQR